MTHFRVTDPVLKIDISSELGPTEACEEFIWQQNECEKWLSLDGVRHGICLMKTPYMRSECYYWQAELHGPSFYSDANGKQLSHGHFIHGQKWGIWRFWYASGVLAKELHYREDKLEGEQKYFAPEGFLRTSITYKDGKACGKLLKYHPEGVLAREALFEDGLKTGLERFWYCGGELQSERSFQDGVPTGRSISWYESGQIAEQIEYLNPSWKFNLKRFRANGLVMIEGKTHEDGSFEEKKFSIENTLTEHRLCLRDSSGKVLEERRLI